MTNLSDKTLSDAEKLKQQESVAFEAPRYLMLSHKVTDYWQSRIKSSSLSVLIAMFRKIKGWHKKSDSISKAQLMKCTGLSKNTIKSAIDELVDLSLIIVEYQNDERGCRPNTYYLNIKEESGESGQNMGGGRSKIDLGVGQKLTPQKKDLTKDTSKENIKRKKSVSASPAKKKLKKPKEKLVAFGEHVSLPEGHYEKLVQEDGEDTVKRRIDEINGYVSRKQPGYKCYVAVYQLFKKNDRNNSSSGSGKSKNDVFHQNSQTGHSLLRSLMSGKRFIGDRRLDVESQGIMRAISGERELIRFDSERFVQEVKHTIQKWEPYTEYFNKTSKKWESKRCV